MKNYGDGNSTVKSSLPSQIKNKAGQTDPEQKKVGKLLPTVKKVQKGWNK